MTRIALIAAVLMLALSSSAEARSCVSTTRSGVHVQISAQGSTSCQFAGATAQRLADLGYAPSSLRVYSPVTHRSYRIWRESLDGAVTGGYLDVRYAGANGIRLHITAYTL